jgi:hypothetical protein
MLLFSLNTATIDHARQAARVTFLEKIKSTDAELGVNNSKEPIENNLTKEALLRGVSLVLE